MVTMNFKYFNAAISISIFLVLALLAIVFFVTLYLYGDAQQAQQEEGQQQAGAVGGVHGQVAGGAGVRRRRRRRRGWQNPQPIQRNVGARGNLNNNNLDRNRQERVQYSSSTSDSDSQSGANTRLGRAGDKGGELGQDSKLSEDALAVNQWMKHVLIAEANTLSTAQVWAQVKEQIKQYIIQHQVAVLEEVAATVQVPTSTVVKGVKEMEGEGVLSGFVDDKGVYFYLNEQDLKQLGEMIMSAGRVSMAQVACFANGIVQQHEGH